MITDYEGVEKCSGEGQGSCKMCEQEGIWNRHWMWDLYKVKEYKGTLCLTHAYELIRKR